MRSARRRGIRSRHLSLGHLGEDRDLGQAGADVVVQVRSDARSDTFELEQPS